MTILDSVLASLDVATAQVAQELPLCPALAVPVQRLAALSQQLQAVAREL
jgi:hypothetical protein